MNQGMAELIRAERFGFQIVTRIGGTDALLQVRGEWTDDGCAHGAVCAGPMADRGAVAQLIFIFNPRGESTYRPIVSDERSDDAAVERAFGMSREDVAEAVGTLLYDLFADVIEADAIGIDDDALAPADRVAMTVH